MGRTRRNSVEYKIGFYRIDAGLDESGQPACFDPEPFLKCIDRLPFAEFGGRRVQDDDGLVSCWIDRLSSPYRVFLGKSRSPRRSLTDRNGNREQLTLDRGRLLLEGIHAVLFFDSPYWIVGCEYNYHGPRIGQLSAYLSRKSNCPPLSLLPLMRHDTEARLLALQDVRLFTIRFHPSAAAQQSRKTHRRRKSIDILDALDAAENTSSVYEAGVFFKSEPRARQKLPRNSLVEYAKSIFSDAERSRTVVSGNIKGFSSALGRVDDIDLLKTHITETVRLRGSNSAASSSIDDQIYAEIERVYEKRKTELLMATGVKILQGDAENESADSFT